MWDQEWNPAYLICKAHTVHMVSLSSFTSQSRWAGIILDGWDSPTLLAHPVVLVLLLLTAGWPRQGWQSWWLVLNIVIIHSSTILSIYSRSRRSVVWVSEVMYQSTMLLKDLSRTMWVPHQQWGESEEESMAPSHHWCFPHREGRAQLPQLSTNGYITPHCWPGLQ